MVRQTLDIAMALEYARAALPEPVFGKLYGLPQELFESMDTAIDAIGKGDNGANHFHTLLKARAALDDAWAKGIDPVMVHDIDATIKTHCLELLEGYPSDMVLGDVYDSDDQVALAVSLLTPGFEYPDHSHRTLGEIMRRAGKTMEAEKHDELQPIRALVFVSDWANYPVQIISTKESALSRDGERSDSDPMAANHGTFRVQTFEPTKRVQTLINKGFSLSPSGDGSLVFWRGNSPVAAAPNVFPADYGAKIIPLQKADLDYMDAYWTYLREMKVEKQVQAGTVTYLPINPETSNIYANGREYDNYPDAYIAALTDGRGTLERDDKGYMRAVEDGKWIYSGGSYKADDMAAKTAVVEQIARNDIGTREYARYGVLRIERDANANIVSIDDETDPQMLKYWGERIQPQLTRPAAKAAGVLEGKAVEAIGLLRADPVRGIEFDGRFFAAATTAEGTVKIDKELNAAIREYGVPAHDVGAVYGAAQKAMAVVFKTHEQSPTLAGEHIGKVEAIEGNRVIQATGLGKYAVHDLSQFEKPPKVGDKLHVKYANGVMTMCEQLAQDGHSVSVSINTR